jgi:hypothetical protein
MIHLNDGWWQSISALVLDKPDNTYFAGGIFFLARSDLTFSPTCLYITTSVSMALWRTCAF